MLLIGNKIDVEKIRPSSSLFVCSTCGLVLANEKPVEPRRSRDNFCARALSFIMSQMGLVLAGKSSVCASCVQLSSVSVVCSLGLRCLT